MIHNYIRVSDYSSVSFKYNKTSTKLLNDYALCIYINVKSRQIINVTVPYST